ncbi:copper homeostasis protein CutC [Dongshaea marina]|uniref:copper homeostasis protein CutC n=1 Tax=Dongshaea marina TaxID=2047966 RepID=UPI000D3E7083|nr:copper homeostasis protein CutC [Dongshaea marina]
MGIKLEVCVDNMESLYTAIRAGADRIELCTGLELGGITPSHGLMAQAIAQSTVPVYPIIRPRQGDFLFSDAEAEMMLSDISNARELGAAGVVVGALCEDGSIHKELLVEMVNAAGPLGVTFHRAIDVCRDWQEALEIIIESGCERVLTSGMQGDALSGSECIAQMQQQAAKRLSVMAGAGVNQDNVAEILRLSGIKEVHLSGKSYRPSAMSFQAPVSMGSVDDTRLNVADYNKIHGVRQQLDAWL